MSGVNYHKVIDRLADAIKELNLCVEAPAAPAERTAEERKQDMAIVLRGLLQKLEQGTAGGAGAGAGGAADAAAEHASSDQKFNLGRLDFGSFRWNFDAMLMVQWLLNQAKETPNSFVNQNGAQNPYASESTLLIDPQTGQYITANSWEPR